MSDHLPECFALLNDSTWDGYCVCAALRSYAERMREAIAALPEYAMRDTCVIAIDALRGDK